MRNAATRWYSPYRRRRPQFPLGGFSLIEVLVALVIVGVAIALALPKIGRIISETKVQRAAQATQNEVQQAFAIAARNRAPVRLTWVSASTQLRITDLAGSTIYRRLGYGEGGGYGLTSSQITVNPTDLVVFPNGLAADSLVFGITRNGYTRTLRATRSGIVRVK